MSSVFTNRASLKFNMLTASELHVTPNKSSWMVSVNFLRPYESINIKREGGGGVEGEEEGEGRMGKERLNQLILL